MKDVIKLATAPDICEFVREELLHTDVLRRSYDDEGLVYRVARRFSRLPRFFYKPSDEYVTVTDEAGKTFAEYVESSHFSPWWGGVQMCTYENQVVQDLYYLHEMEHAAMMPYGPDAAHIVTNPVTFKNKIRDNEHEASTLSEMTIYCEFPQLASTHSRTRFSWTVSCSAEVTLITSMSGCFNAGDKSPISSNGK